MTSLRTPRLLAASLLLIGVALLTQSHVVAQDATPMAAGSPTNSAITFVASGLSNPRGFTWDSDGTLVLSEAGIGGQDLLAKFEGFTGTGGPTSSIGTVLDGCYIPLDVGIHSALWQEAGWIWGAMDVEYLKGDLYVLVSGSGETFGTPDLVSGIYRANNDGTLTLVDDISNWLAANQPKFVAPDYAGKDGSEFDMEPSGDAFLVSVADAGQIIRAVPDGEMTLFADLSVDHPVPTGIAVDADGNAYVGFETTPPYPNGESKVVKITPDGTISDFWTGLTAVTDVEMGPDGELYAVEMSIDNSQDPPFLNSTTGRIVRQTGPDSQEAVVTDAPLPVDMGFGSDGALYFDYPAFAPSAGEGVGVLVRVDLSNGPVSFAGVSAPMTCST